MKHPTTQRLYEHWDKLRGSRPAPDRSEVEPGQIRGILGDTFILEVIDPMTYRYRLAGTRLCALHCRELKSRNILRGWRGDDQEAVSTLLSAVSDDAAAAVLGISGHTEREQTIDMEMLLLPLHVPGEGCSRILGSCVALQQPYWTGLHPILGQSVKSVRLLWPDERPAFLSTRATGAFASVPVISSQSLQQAAVAAEAGRQVGHLRVFDGGKN
ncbi:PAS domain-containing protein [Stappia sp. F7233]|uniref:PAS domain-containing protein n=1 Tax=Stappia albiluteola TaxID=2758565 RepID=A0A839AEQ1_9HYPH|nr:PAS domain-containing protein [Stappia albiluteola]MBA5777615.1 PAS domain-containing protein [Stappia albiluteola]